jgi:hypothetical protein
MQIFKSQALSSHDSGDNFRSNRSLSSGSLAKELAGNGAGSPTEGKVPGSQRVAFDDEDIDVADAAGLSESANMIKDDAVVAGADEPEVESTNIRSQKSSVSNNSVGVRPSTLRGDLNEENAASGSAAAELSVGSPEGSAVLVADHGNLADSVDQLMSVTSLRGDQQSLISATSLHVDNRSKPDVPVMDTQAGSAPVTGRRVSFPDNVVPEKTMASPGHEMSMKRQTSMAAPALGKFKPSAKSEKRQSQKQISFEGEGGGSLNNSSGNLYNRSGLNLFGSSSAMAPPALPEVYVVFKWNNNVEVGRTTRAFRDGSAAYWNDDQLFYLKYPTLEADKNGVMPVPQLTIELWEDHTNKLTTNASQQADVNAPGEVNFSRSNRDLSPIRRADSRNSLETAQQSHQAPAQAAPKKRRASLISSLLGARSDSADVLIGCLFLEGEELSNFLGIPCDERPY